MTPPQKRCFRCLGRKKVYEMSRNGGYTLVCNGSPEVRCPLCAGMGLIDDVKKMDSGGNSKKVEVSVPGVLVASAPEVSKGISPKAGKPKKPKKSKKSKKNGKEG